MQRATCTVADEHPHRFHGQCQWSKKGPTFKHVSIMIKALRNLQVYDAHAPVSETTCVPSGWVGAHWDLNPRCHFHYEMGGVKPNMKKKL